MRIKVHEKQETRLYKVTSEARNSDADLFDYLYELGQELYKWRKGELSFEEATPGIVKGLERHIGPRTAFNEFKRRGVKDSDYFMATSMAEYAAVALMDKGEDFVKSFLADKNASVPPDVWDAAVKTWIDDEKDL